MSIKNLLKLMTDSGIEENEAKKELQMLAEHFCDYTAKDKCMGIELSDNDFNLLKSKVEERICTRKPIQHIIGEAYFMGEYFKVTQDVLVPRDETEILVAEAIKIINSKKFKNVLDIGTGSGCIACTIAKKTNAVVLGVDISSDALRIALDNVTKLGINNRAVFRKSDLYSKIRDEETFDIIISNPPYIPVGTILDKEVMQEPSLALFASNNGLEFYEKIIEKAPQYLNANGYIMFELGINQYSEVKKMLEKDFIDIKIIKDLAGIERVIIAKLR